MNDLICQEDEETNKETAERFPKIVKRANLKIKNFRAIYHQIPWKMIRTQSEEAKRGKKKK